MSTWFQHSRLPQFVFLRMRLRMMLIFGSLVDLTMHASMSSTPRSESLSLEPSSPTEDTSNLGDEERGLRRQAVPVSVHSHPTSSTSSPPGDETELQTRPNSISSSTGAYIKRKTSQLFEAVSGPPKPGNEPLAPKLLALVDAYARSTIAADIKAETDQVHQGAENGNSSNGGGDELPDVVFETSLLRGRKRASWGTQFRILSGRAFKNLYRDPALLASHYLASIALARECSYAIMCPPPNL